MLSRLLLRLAIVNALTPQPDDPSPPTIARASVFDSRLDDLEFDEGRVELPLIIVYTEEDENTQTATAAGFNPGTFERHINVRVEVAIGSFTATTEDGVRKVSYGLPTTDAELEALLDIFEAQVYRTLAHPIRPASLVVQQLVKQWTAFHSTVSRSNDGNNRLAARTMIFRFKVAPECGPGVSLDPITKALSVPSFDNAPYLNDLIKGLAVDPANQALIDMLSEAAGAGPQIPAPQLKRLSIKNDAVNPADQNLLAILGRSIGPDTRIENQLEWVIP